MFRAVRCYQRCRKGFSFPRIDPRRFLTVKERWALAPSRRVDCCDGVKLPHGNNLSQYRLVIKLARPTKKPARGGLPGFMKD